MAKAQGLNNRLKLSDLKKNAEYPMGAQLSDGKCLIHVKLTDFCVKSVESLINSEKGAFFSLWFEESGGTMAIPLANGGSRRFKFKTALRQEAEGKGSLECVHQAMELPSKHHQLMCIGPIDHRLMVQGTDEVYDRTKKLMKEAEEKKKEARAQEIKLPGKARIKSKLFSSPSSSSPARKPPGRPPHHKSISSTLGPKTGGPKPPSAATRSPRTLRERIIHLLALKPQRRSDVVTRLKKETKRSESAMSNLDFILNEVSEVRQGSFYLKQQYFPELQVEEWPFYSDTERQLIRRSISTACAKEGAALSAPSGELQPLKRPLGSSTAKFADPPPPKKPKISHPTPTSYQPPPQESTLPPPHSTSHHKPPNSLHTSMPSIHKLATPSTSNAGHKTATVPSFPTSISSNTPSSKTSAVAQNSQAQPLTQQQMEPPHLYSSFVPASASSSTGLTTLTSTDTMRVATLPLTVGTRNGKSLKISQEEAAAEPSQDEDLPEAKKMKKNKKEKKKKKKDKHSTRLASREGEREPSRLASGEGEREPSWLPGQLVQSDGQFLPIVSEEQRARYKQIFNEEYEVYMNLKERIESAAKEFTPLTEKWNSVSKNSAEGKELRKRIQEKYPEMQQYQEQKRRFEELHLKLSHIKQLVLNYDNRQAQPKQQC